MTMDCRRLSPSVPTCRIGPSRVPGHGFPCEGPGAVEDDVIERLGRTQYYNRL
jgi:hypothetical protein